jgi:alkylation response protein AidB-like acyl-CoA dehydrogenase
VDFRESPEHARFRLEVRSWLEKNLPSGWGTPGYRGPDTAAERMRFTRWWQGRLFEGGWAGLAWPRAYGGRELGVLEQMIWSEEYARAWGPDLISLGVGISLTGPVLIAKGKDWQRQAFLRKILTGEHIWCQGFSEPGAGSDLAGLKCTAVRQGDHYIVNGQKVWTSRAEHSDLLLLLARTTPRDRVAKRTEGLSVFLVDLRAARGVTIRPIRTMLNHATTEVFFENLEVPAENLIGEEGKGFRYILDGMNAERILIASECIGDARWFIAKATDYAKARVVFDRPIGQNQGVQFPIARAYAASEAADLMVQRAAALYDGGEPCAKEANMAKLLAADASWQAADMCVQTHGGFGFAAEYDVERKFRETRLYQVAPISTNLILAYLAEHVLGLPRSY